MKHTEIRIGSKYSDLRGTVRKVLIFQTETGKSFGSGGLTGGGLGRVNIFYEVKKGRGRGQINIMTIRGFAAWAKREVN